MNIIWFFKIPCRWDWLGVAKPFRRGVANILMAQLKGETLTLKNKESTVKVEWKQGSFLGFGGDRMQEYKLCSYTLSSGSEVPVYIQCDYDVPSKLTIDSKLQCGMQEGVIFFVYHEKSQLPYQNRFCTDALLNFAHAANSASKMAKGVDPSRLAGDYLHDIWFSKYIYILAKSSYLIEYLYYS